MYSWEPGNRVWYRAPNSHTQIYAVVVKVGPKRVTIQTANQNMFGVWVRETTSVKSENLYVRNKLCEHLGEREAANV